MPVVESVGGPLQPDALGTVLVHEHLKMRSEPVPDQFPHLYDDQAAFEAAVRIGRALVEQGVHTICDPSCMYHGREVRFMRRVADETGLQVIPCTGIYSYNELPQALRNRDEGYLADAFVHDIEQGIQGTDIKAAFLKCAVDEAGVTDDLAKLLKACALASKRTGRPIMAHSHPGTRRGLEIMDVFEDEGVDPRKVQIAHTGDTDDLVYIEELLERGPFIGMDRYGLDVILAADKRNDTVMALLERGYAGRMFLSADACAEFDWFPEELVERSLPNWKSTYVFGAIVPQLLEAGMTDEQLEEMTVENPKRWLGS